MADKENKVSMAEIEEAVGRVYGLWRFRSEMDFDAKSNGKDTLDGITKREYVERYVRERFKASPQGKRYSRSN